MYIWDPLFYLYFGIRCNVEEITYGTDPFWSLYSFSMSWMGTIHMRPSNFGHCIIFDVLVGIINGSHLNETLDAFLLFWIWLHMGPTDLEISPRCILIILNENINMEPTYLNLLLF